MFEELYRNSGFIHIPLDDYVDGKPFFEPQPVTYFAQESTFRDDSGVLQCETVFFCKGYSAPVPAGSKFVATDGREYDISVSKRIFDHFENGFECYKLWVAK